MKKYLIIAGALFFTGIGYAIAQQNSTATQTVVGIQSIVGGRAVWAPISTTNPLPVRSN